MGGKQQKHLKAHWWRNQKILVNNNNRTRKLLYQIAIGLENSTIAINSIKYNNRVQVHTINTRYSAITREHTHIHIK